MGSSVNEFHATKLQEEIRLACRSLEKIGYESLVIVASQDSHTEMGSERGRYFIDCFDLVVEFLKFCQDSPREDCVDQQTEIASVPPAEPRIIEAELDTFEDVFGTCFPTTGSDQDGAFDEMDVDEDKKHRVATEGIMIPSNEIVVVKQVPISTVMKRMSRNKLALQDSTNSDKTAQATPKAKIKSVKSDKTSIGKFPETTKKTYDCDKCDKKYARFEKLTFHIRSKHTGERPYKCRDCGKTFVSRGQLGAHKVVHSDVTPYVCKECGQLFKRSVSLWHHQLTHLEVKKYKCVFCPKAFADPSTLQYHRMIHTDERPHCCEMCGKSFRTPRALREHQRVHTGEKPFTCETCGESFRRKKNMVTHQRRKHEV